MACLAFGTANASPVTVSFWVKSSITGQFSTFLTNATEVYSCAIPYTINSAITWERKVITFSGATAGTWVGSTNGTGLILGFGLGNGTGLLGTPGVWAAASYYGATGDTNWMAASGNTWQITGVQLERGSTATPFEHRSYGQELALCQRYFQIVGGTGTEHFAPGVMASDRINIVYSFKQTMRASPSFTATSFGSAFTNLTIYNGITSLAVTGSNENYMSPNSASIGFTHGSSTTAGSAGYVYFNSTAARVAFSAEL